MYDPLYPGRPSPPSHRAYATGGAIEEARLVGLLIRRDEWRDMMLAITDTMATDGERSLSPITAAYVGPVRDGERWQIGGLGVTFDVLYHPDRAQVYRIARVVNRRPDAA